MPLILGSVSLLCRGVATHASGLTERSFLAANARNPVRYLICIEYVSRRKIDCLEAARPQQLGPYIAPLAVCKVHIYIDGRCFINAIDNLQELTNTREAMDDAAVGGCHRDPEPPYEMVVVDEDDRCATALLRTHMA